jgi:hypothetical protein
MQRDTETSLSVADSNGRTKARDADKLLERIRHLESALAQANASQCQSIIKTPCGLNDKKPSNFDEDGVQRRFGSEERLKGSLTRDLPLTRQASQTSEDGIHAHIAFVTRLFGQNWYHRGLPIVSENGLEWITSRTDQNTAVLRSYLFRGHSSRPYWNFSALQGHTLTGELWDLPDKSTVSELFDILFNSSFQILFPTLDKVLFDETVNAAYQPSTEIHTPHTHISARACFWAALAVMSYLKVSRQMNLSIGADVCAARAQKFLELAHGPANLDILQALALLVSSSICLLQCGHLEK